MIRTPLRPLARVLSARERGENPDTIERENRRQRREAVSDAARGRAEIRLLLLGAAFVAGFATIGVRMAALAVSQPIEPQIASSGDAILASRADILDRNGRVLATNLLTHSLYAQPQEMIDPVRVARELVAIFPDLDAARLTADFTGSRKFIWIRKKISPEQMQAVHDIGDPGLLFGPREMRLYPNGELAAHVLGGASFGREDVASAEVVGVAGVEKAFDGWLRDPANNGAPLRLTLDLTVQATLEEVLADGMKLMKAKAASAVLMHVGSGEIIAIASLPDFDPNARPVPSTTGEAGDSPLFNRAVQGVYELGSTFKVFAVAQALELGLVTPATMIDTRGPLVWGKYRINDFHDYGARLSVTDVIVQSSNIGAARIAMLIGAERQRAFMDALGFLSPTPVELAEAHGARPLLPPNWSELSTMTIAYGHGLSASPLHLATAYATLANGGHRVTPTLVLGAARPVGEAVISPANSEAMMSMLRQVVTRGTASFAEVPGYAVGGKTGTADKPKPGGGYYDEKVLATFAAVFPAHAPEYVLVLSLDEPVEDSGSVDRRTAGWTAVPVGAELIRRAAPLLGLRPTDAPVAGPGLSLARN
ncbi:peptidoglycan D,D-transpeptidase FtsI family protein [Phaeovulum sp.]|uniref:peptidoglycan D,D-transpeptidase FtsI family protein n=1 Tax=Phaeovulum sp. TaxID=2934796 RepID=UPI002730A834|nr:penicillin-binding protein 2 [Phaeovulum sp.]MDP1668447.1 penicillin-binding protein 2 [Phaeovulum sp.]MDZ4118890.1 penicillin-binding protein 2 [Phaeovulum sp.]